MVLALLTLSKDGCRSLGPPKQGSRQVKENKKKKKRIRKIHIEIKKRKWRQREESITIRRGT